ALVAAGHAARRLRGLPDLPRARRGETVAVAAVRVAARRARHHGRRRDGRGVWPSDHAGAGVLRAGGMDRMTPPGSRVLTRAAIVAVGSELLETTRLDT